MNSVRFVDVNSGIISDYEDIVLQVKSKSKSIFYER